MISNRNTSNFGPIESRSRLIETVSTLHFDVFHVKLVVFHIGYFPNPKGIWSDLSIILTNHPYLYLSSHIPQHLLKRSLATELCQWPSSLLSLLKASPILIAYNFWRHLHNRWVLHCQVTTDWNAGIVEARPIHVYSISQEICTRFRCALISCGYAIVHNESTWNIYP